MRDAFKRTRFCLRHASSFHLHAGVLACLVVHSFVGGVAAPRSRALRHTACSHFRPVFATVGEPALDQDIDVK